MNSLHIGIDYVHAEVTKPSVDTCMAHEYATHSASSFEQIEMVRLSFEQIEMVGVEHGGCLTITRQTIESRFSTHRMPHDYIDNLMQKKITCGTYWLVFSFSRMLALTIWLITPVLVRQKILLVLV